MTVHIFKPNASVTGVNWNNPAIWTNGVVPNSSDAGAYFETVFFSGTTTLYRSTITIDQTSSITTNWLYLQANTLVVAGSLTATAPVTVMNGGSLLINGSLSAPSLTLGTNGSYNLASVGGKMTVGSLNIAAGQLQGGGTIEADSVINHGSIVGGVNIDADSFSNEGSIIANGSLNITTPAGQFAGLTQGNLTSGTYAALNGGTLNLNVGQSINAIDATVSLTGTSTFNSFNPATSQYESLLSSLHVIGQQGVLALGSGSFGFGALDISGTIQLGAPPIGGSQPGLNYDATLTSSSLHIAPSGTIMGSGSVLSPIVNDGVIEASEISYSSLSGGINGGSLLINGAVTGSGYFKIDAGISVPQGRSEALVSSKLTIGAPTAQNVVFENNLGHLILKDVSAFSGTIAPSSVGIENPNVGNTINLQGVSQSSITGMNYVGNTSGGTLILNQATGAIQLKFEGNFNLSSFKFTAIPGPLTSDPQSLQITVNPGVGVACFAQGTHIRTSNGDVFVERLQPGDLVTTASGEHRPIVWIGKRVVTAESGHPARDWWPVHVIPNAFGPGLPSRELVLSPGHCVCVDILGEIFIPVYRLLNGHSITQVPVDAVTYWHVELESQDVVLANDLPSETYLDVGNREAFEQAVAIRPVPVVRTVGAYCRPRMESGAIVDAVRDRLDMRSVEQGWTVTHDMDLHLMVDGERIEGDVDGDMARFLFPATAKDVRLVSNTFCPADSRPDADERALGIALTALSLSDGLRHRHSLPLDHPVLSDSYYVEGDEQKCWRWTNGCQLLPAELWQDFRSYVILRVEFLPDAAIRWMAPEAQATERAQQHQTVQNVVAFQR